jgi:hypothetical protein
VAVWVEEQEQRDALGAGQQLVDVLAGGAVPGLPADRGSVLAQHAAQLLVGGEVGLDEVGLHLPVA